MSGYQHCACRDCFEIAIGEGGPELCNACEDAGCSVDDGECQCEPEHDELEDRAVEWVGVNHPELEGEALEAKVREAKADLAEIDAWQDAKILG